MFKVAEVYATVQSEGRADYLNLYFDGVTRMITFQESGHMAIELYTLPATTSKVELGAPAEVASGSPRATSTTTTGTRLLTMAARWFSGAVVSARLSEGVRCGSPVAEADCRTGCPARTSSRTYPVIVVGTRSAGGDLCALPGDPGFLRGRASR